MEVKGQLPMRLIFRRSPQFLPQMTGRNLNQGHNRLLPHPSRVAAQISSYTSSHSLRRYIQHKINKYSNCYYFEFLKRLTSIAGPLVVTSRSQNADKT
jgi:hypothetical protein